MEQFGKVFPELKKNLVDYRDKYMANKILSLNREHPHILAVVGEGHVSGMAKLMKGAPMEIIHLNTVRKIAKELEEGKKSLIDYGHGTGNSIMSMTLEYELTQQGLELIL